MKKTKRKDTPFEERRAVAYAVASIEQYTGDVVGTKADRPGMDYDGSGDPTQMDCVDKATNMTSYLLVLQNNKLLKFHTVSIPISKGDPMRGVAGWPHWTAILRETAARAFSVLIASERGSKSLFGRIFATQSGSHFAGKCSSQRYAVDSWAFVSGENPAVVEIEKWYIKDLEHLPPSQM